MHPLQKALFAAVVAVFGVTSCGPPTSQAPAEQETAPSQITAQRIADIVAINAALIAHHQANGGYPVSQGAQGFISAYGASLGARWIPELSIELPRDPANADAGDGPQYLYISDGRDYKLIAHATDDCGPLVEVQGVRIDPRRRSEATCWGYGFWTPAAEPL